MSLQNKWILLFFVLLAVFMIFLPSLRHGFVNYDDELYVTGNTDIRSLDLGNIKNIFTSTAVGGYIPLTIFSFALEHHFFGLNAFVFHLDNVLLHLTVVALLFFLGMRLGLDVWACGLAALLFGIHPMHVESVVWVTERKDVLYACFYLLALHAHWSYLGHQRKRFFILTIIFGCLSMLAKPMALSLPLVLLLLDGMKGRKWTANVLVEKIPHLFYIIPIAMVTYHFQTRVIQTQPVCADLVESVLTWIWCAVFYLWKFFWPLELMPIYARPEPVSLLNPVYTAAGITLILLVGMLVRFKNHRWLMFAVLFYFCSIFFLFRFNASDINVVADRYMYLPSAGFCLLFGFCVHRTFFSLKNNVFKAFGFVFAIVLLLTALGLKTFVQSGVWKDSLTLNEEMIRQNPNAWIAFYNRGKFYEDQKQWDLALQDYSRTIQIKPEYVSALNNRAKVLSYFGRNQDALADLDRAIKIRPDFVVAYGNRGLVHAKMNRYDLAVEDFDRGLKIQSDSAELYYYRSLAYMKLNRWDDALQSALQAQTLKYPGIENHIKELNSHISSQAHHE